MIGARRANHMQSIFEFANIKSAKLLIETIGKRPKCMEIRDSTQFISTRTAQKMPSDSPDEDRLD